MHTTAVIVQSNYLPWKGYFDLLRQADIFVLYDDVQYTRRDWRNRNVIKTPQGLHWLTVPVNSKGQYHQDIERITVSSSDWIERHWSTIAMSYGKSPGFFEYGEALRSMLHGCADCTLLSEINHRLIQGLAGLLDIDTPIARSSTYGKVPGKNENLIHLCQAVGATRYLSGPSASSYLDPTLFSRAGIDLSYMDYSGYPEYKQPHGPFNHFVSVIDLLMSTGRQAGKYLIREETARAPDGTNLHQEIALYYERRLHEHGPTPQGVDWNGAESQQLRFSQLIRILEPGYDPKSTTLPTLNDLGCGYGALLTYLADIGMHVDYEGIDISAAMVQTAQACHAGNANARFQVGAACTRIADYSVASGLFNVRQEVPAPLWEKFIHATLDDLDRSSSRGFAFNCLTSYSDAEKMKPHLHYCAPEEIFRHCKARFSRHVALLHDYGLYEFTILVRKQVG